MAGIAGLEPTMPVSKTGALATWLYPNVVVICAGLEPSITALKGLCPDHLDERTILGSKLPGSGNRSYQDIINADIKQCRKNNQIINSRKGCAVLPLVDGLRRIEAEDHLDVCNSKTSGLPKIYDIGTGLCQINGKRLITAYLASDGQI